MRRSGDGNELGTPRDSGTVKTRTVLSALPEISRVDVVLKRNVVGGNS